MIKSITFPLNGSGYIYNKIEKPIKPNKDYYASRYKHLANNVWEKRYKSEMAQYRKELAFFKKHEGEFVLGQCSLNLVGKTFNFEKDKVNILFGPNGSGKSTIIKAIAGACGCLDGFTKTFNPIQIDGYGFSANVDFNESKELFANHIKDLSKNTCNVDWDGIPVYYDNFRETELHSVGMAGDMVGSLFKDVGEELMYIMDRKSISAGQKAMWLMSKVIKVAENKISLEDIIKPECDKFMSSGNDLWHDCYKSQYEYWAQYPKFFEKGIPTIVFDEIDSNFDVENVWNLHHNFLPAFIKKYGCQVIIVSHSPLILTDKILGDSEHYNVISLDENYTRDVKEMLNGVKF